VSHEISFVDAVIQPEVRVLGLKLKPFSIGHEVLLLRGRNPLVILTGKQFNVFTPESQYKAIQDATLICHNSWLKNHRPQRGLGFWKWRIRKMDHGQALVDFANYRAAGSTFPRGPSKEAVAALYKDDEPGRFLGAPFLCRLYQFIIGLPDREIRIHGKTAFDFPLGLATFLYMSKLEQDGGCKIENDKEEQARLEWEAALAGVSSDRRIA
jgi:hypothetical protein